MIENTVRSIAGVGRGLGVDPAGDEPSHIHLPRRRRTVRPDDQGISVAHRAYTGDADSREHSPTALEEA